MCITWLQFGIHLDPFGPNSNSTLGPSWDPLRASWSQLAQVRRKLKLGPSKYAPVRSNLRPRTGKFDPSRLLVGPSRPALFLSVLFPGCGGVLVTKRLEQLPRKIYIIPPNLTLMTMKWMAYAASAALMHIKNRGYPPPGSTRRRTMLLLLLLLLLLLPPTTYYLLPTTYYLLPTTY